MTSSFRGQLIGCYIVPGQVHPLLAVDRSPGYQRLNLALKKVGEEIQKSGADLILYFSTQWLSVLGYTFQCDPNPKWKLVDPNWHDLGTLHYDLKVDPSFSDLYLAEVQELGHTVRRAQYKGFPIDPGTIVGEKLLNPESRIPISAVSCNMYAEKDEMLAIGQAALRAIKKSGKKVVAVCVTGLSGRYHTDEISFENDRISSAKDDEWNRKILEILGEGRLDDVSEVAREYSRQANADMGFRGVWWLNGLSSKTNDFTAQVHAYEPVYGTGAAVVSLIPKRPIETVEGLTGGEADLVQRLIEPVSQQLKKVGEPKSSSVSRSKDLGVETFQPVVAETSTEKLAHSSRAPLPVGPYPHARREGEFIFLSGVGPRQAGSSAIPGVEQLDSGEFRHDVVAQTEAVIQNVKAILEDAGSSFGEIVDVQVFLTDMQRDFKKFNEVYSRYFGGVGQPKPCRTTVEVGALPTPICVELKVIARSSQA